MSITWSKVASPAVKYLGCGSGGVTCLGGGQMLATVEEIDVSDRGVLRSFFSADNGFSWQEIEPNIFSTNEFELGKIRVAGFRTALVSMAIMAGGSQTFDPVVSFAARTTSGGVAYTSTITSAFWTTLGGAAAFYTVKDFIVTDQGVVFAIGDIANAGPDEHNIVRSITSGATFTSLEFVTGMGTADLLCGTYMGSQIVLVAGSTGRIGRSVDLGTTWATTAMSVTSAISGMDRIGPLDSGRAIAVTGRTLTPDSYLTVDAGANWTNQFMGGGFAPSQVMAASANVVVAGTGFMTAATIAAGGKPWRLSTDGGATFVDDNVLTSPLTVGADYTVKQFAVADDGAILAMCFLDASLPNEIWRGVIDGFTGPGPCAVPPITSRVVMEFTL